jgi:hypothetical protein
MSTLIAQEKLERVFQIFYDIKKTLSYDKHTGQWSWFDRDEPAYPQGYFSTAYEAMLDAVEPYLYS